MWRTLTLCSLALASLMVNAQAVFMTRSELWARATGLDKLPQHVATWNEYRQSRDLEYGKLAALKTQLQQCGNCSDRNRLAAQAKQLEDRLSAADRNLCGAFAAMGSLNQGSSVNAMSRLLGVSTICEARSEARIDSYKQAMKEEYLAKARAGDIKAYGHLGQLTMTMFSNLPFEQQASLACPYWYIGAQKGDMFSLESLSQLCYATGSEAERKAGFDLVKACAEKGEPRCLEQLGWFYASTRNVNAPSPVPTDDAEALRLWDMAAAKGHGGAKAAAASLRTKRGR